MYPRCLLVCVVLFFCPLVFSENSEKNCPLGSTLADFDKTLAKLRSSQSLNIVVSFGSHYFYDTDNCGQRDYDSFLKTSSKPLASDGYIKLGSKKYRLKGSNLEKKMVPYDRSDLTSIPLERRDRKGICFKQNTFNLVGENPSDPPIQLSVIRAPYAIGWDRIPVYEKKAIKTLQSQYFGLLQKADIIVLNGHGSDIGDYCERRPFRSRKPGLVYLNGCNTADAFKRQSNDNRFYLGNDDCSSYGCLPKASFSLLQSFFVGKDGKGILKSLPQTPKPMCRPVKTKPNSNTTSDRVSPSSFRRNLHPGSNHESIR